LQYGAWGEPKGGNNAGNASPFGFTGRWGGYTDVRLGVVVNLNREYWWEAGRWGSRDPVGIRGGINLFSYAYNNIVRFVDPEGLDIWVEGPSDGEPQGHLSVNIGNPDGTYDSYSFGVNGDPGFGGEAYRDTSTGGEIDPDRYVKTTPEEDKAMKESLDFLVGKKADYRPWMTCRKFAKGQFDRLKKRFNLKPTKPPSRPKKPNSKSRSVPFPSSTTVF
jgi:RHS repeat-associated protein